MISYRLLHAILFTPTDDHGKWGIPALFWGEPGAAKTDILEALSAAWGMPSETLSPGERGEGAFGVTPGIVAFIVSGATWKHVGDELSCVDRLEIDEDVLHERTGDALDWDDEEGTSDV